MSFCHHYKQQEQHHQQQEQHQQQQEQQLQQVYNRIRFAFFCFIVFFLL